MTSHARLATLTHSDFLERLNEEFLVGPELRLVLTKVEQLGSQSASAGGNRVPFSLLFTGPARPFLPQGTHSLANEGLGTLEFFLVPLGPGDGARMRYEAIFT